MRHQQQQTRPETGLGFFIPCLNEAGSIAGVAAAIRRRFPSAPIVVVDDGSTDETQRLALEAGAYCVRLASNMGVATASMVGMACCVQLGCQAMIRLDGDGQHLAADIDSLIRAWRDSGADLVTGSRYLRGETYTSPLRQVGIVVLRFILRWLYGVRVTDPTSGFRLYTRTTAIWFLRRQYPVDYRKRKSWPTSAWQAGSRSARRWSARTHAWKEARALLRSAPGTSCSKCAARCFCEGCSSYGAEGL